MSFLGRGRRRRRGREDGSAPVSGIRWRISGFSLAGAGLAAGSIYLCHFTFVRDLSPSSVAVLAAGLGLLGSFCVLTVAAIGDIRQLVFNQVNQFQPVFSLVISLASLAALVGLVIRGVTL